MKIHIFIAEEIWSQGWEDMILTYFYHKQQSIVIKSDFINFDQGMPVGRKGFKGKFYCLRNVWTFPVRELEWNEMVATAMFVDIHVADEDWW